MKRRRRQEGGASISEDESMEQATSPTAVAKSAESAAAPAVVAEDAVAASQVTTAAATAAPGSHPSIPDKMLPLETLIALPMAARWTPLSLRVRLWHNERRRTLSGDKRPKLSDLPAFLASHPQYRVHHDETRVLQVLELARDSLDGVHERHCAKCRSAQRSKTMIVCQSCTYAWHRECYDKPVTDSRTLVCDECLRRNPFNVMALHQNALQQHLQIAQNQRLQPASTSPEPAVESGPITVQISKKFKTKPVDASKKNDATPVPVKGLSRESNGAAGNDSALESLPQQAALVPEAPIPSTSKCVSETSVFSRENFRLLFNFLSKLMDNGFISKHEQGLMKNLIIARDSQAVLMLSIVDIVEEGGDLNDAVDSLRRILLVS